MNYRVNPQGGQSVAIPGSGDFLRPGDAVPRGLYDEAFEAKMRKQGVFLPVASPGQAPDQDPGVVETGAMGSNIGDEVRRSTQAGELAALAAERQREEARRATRASKVVDSPWTLDPDGLIGLKLDVLKVMISDRDSQGQYASLDAISTEEEAIAILSADFDPARDAPIELAQTFHRRG